MKKIAVTGIIISVVMLLATLISCIQPGGSNPVEFIPTVGLEYTLINGDTEYSVTRGTADTSGHVIIPEYREGKRVTALGDGAFIDCTTMTSLTIPDGVTSIDDMAFYNCTSLTEIIANPVSPPSAGGYIFYGCNALIAIRVPNGSVTAYQTTSWSDYSSLIVMQ